MPSAAHRRLLWWAGLHADCSPLLAAYSEVTEIPIYWMHPCDSGSGSEATILSHPSGSLTHKVTKSQSHKSVGSYRHHDGRLGTG